MRGLATIPDQPGWNSTRYELQVWADICTNMLGICGVGPKSLGEQIMREFNDVTAGGLSSDAEQFEPLLVFGDAGMGVSGDAGVQGAVPVKGAHWSATGITFPHSGTTGGYSGFTLNMAGLSSVLVTLGGGGAVTVGPAGPETAAVSPSTESPPWESYLVQNQNGDEAEWVSTTTNSGDGYGAGGGGKSDSNDSPATGGRLATLKFDSNGEPGTWSYSTYDNNSGNNPWDAGNYGDNNDPQ